MQKIKNDIMRKQAQILCRRCEVTGLKAIIICAFWYRHIGDSAKPQQNYDGNGEISNFAAIKILKF